MRLVFRFFGWNVHICIARRSDAYAWLQTMVEDAMIYGEGVIRVAPDDREVRMPNPLVPPKGDHFGFGIKP